jgi:glycine C-acetyltransferase
MDDLARKLESRKNCAKKLIVSDGIFSMDGDIAPLREIVRLAQKYGAATMVDEAHSAGIYGATGAGLTEFFGLQNQIDIVMGTFSKAFGALGGYVAGRRQLMRFLYTTARPAMFSVALPPAIAASILAGIEEIRRHPELRIQVLENGEYLRDGMQRIGYDTLGSETHIVPILIGDEIKATELSERLFERNIYAPCIKWPAVAKGKARLRFAATALHTKKQIDTLLQACEDIGRDLGIV